MARKYKTTYRKDFIVERPDGFQYKRHIPEGLRPLFGGRTAWTKFLGRITRKEAEAAAREQAIEHDRLIAGASAVEVGTATFWDPRSPLRIAGELSAFLRRENRTD